MSGQRVVTVLAIAATMAVLGLQIRSIGQRVRLRPLLDLLRLAVQVAGVIAASSLVGVSAPLIGLVIAAGLSCGLGFVQGRRIEVTGEEGRLFVSRPMGPIMLWGVGLVAVQVAGWLDHVNAVEAGQLLSWAGAGQALGLFLGRQGPIDAQRRPSGPARAVARSFVVLIVAGLAFAASDRPARAAQEETGYWELSGEAVNPAGNTPRPGWSLSVSPTSMSVTMTFGPDDTSGAAGSFEASWERPPNRLEPGVEMGIPVTVSGQVVGSRETQFFFGLDVIMIDNGRWNNTAVGAGASCAQTTVISGIYECTDPQTNTGTLPYRPTTFGDTYTVGIGALGCGACYVQWTYTWVDTTATPATPGTEAGAGVTVPPTTPDIVEPDTGGTDGLQPDDGAPPADEEIDPDEALGTALGGLVAAVAAGAITLIEALGQLPAPTGQGAAGRGAGPVAAGAGSDGGITDGSIFDPHTPPGDVAVLNGGPGANPATAFTSGTGSPGTCSVFGLPTYSVNTATRNLVIEDTIYAWGGRGPGIALRLTYNSFVAAGQLFGPGWHFSYESHLGYRDGIFLVWGGAGQTARFRQRTDDPARADALDDDPRHLVADGGAWVVQEPDGTQCRYVIVADGTWRPRAVVDPAGEALTLSYDDRGRLARIVDASGRAVEVGHDDAGRCRTLVLPDGRTAHFAYDQHGRLSEVRDLAGIATTYGYEDAGRLVSMAVDEGRKLTRFTYDPDEARPAVAAIEDALGLVTRYELISREPRVVAVIGPDGATTRVTSVAGLTTAIDDDAGRTARFEHRGRLVTGVAGAKAQVRIARDDVGRVRSLVDSLGRHEELTRDDVGRVVSHQIGPGTTHRVSYGGHGRPVSLLAPGGYTTTIEYDEHAQPVAVVDPLGARSELERDRYGNVVAHRGPEGAVTRFHYDDHGLRLTGITGASGGFTQVRYDPNDRVVAVVNPDGTEVVHEYSCCAGARTVDELGYATTLRRDELLRVTEEVDALGWSTKVIYDATGHPSEVVDPLGRERRWRYEVGGRVAAVVDPLGRALRIGYDDAGRPSSVSAGAGGTTRFDLDAVGRVVAVTDPLGRTARVEFDDRGRVRSRTNARGSTQRMERDVDGRLVGVTGDGTSPVGFARDAVGRIVGMRDSRGETWWRRGPTGRVVETVGPDGWVTRYEYDGDGRVTSVGAPDQFAVHYEHDERGRVVCARFAGARIDFSYDATGRVVGEERSNGTSSTYRYDAKGALVALRHGAGERTDVEMEYERDAAGRVVAVSGVEPISPARVGGEERVSYDEADQVDWMGNARWRHDADGNVVGADDLWAAAFDPAGRLVELHHDGHRDTFTYDGFGRRVSEVRDGVRVDLHHDPAGHLLFETDGRGGLARFYVYRGDTMVAWVEANGVRFVHADQRGDVLAVTDESGEIVAAFAYAPFGEVAAATGPEWHRMRSTFAGAHGVRSDGGGWYATANREYHAPSGRFVQPDPIGLRGGANRYVYAGNDPVNRIDPWGTDWRSTWEDIRRDPIGWFDEHVGQPGQELIDRIEDTYIRPWRDRLVGTSGAIDVGRAPGGINTLNRVGPRLRPGVPADRGCPGERGI